MLRTGFIYHYLCNVCVLEGVCLVKSSITQDKRTKHNDGYKRYNTSILKCQNTENEEA